MIERERFEKWCDDKYYTINEKEAAWEAWQAARAEIERKDEALKSAKRFIENGIEFGYIPTPEPPDSACNTLPMIKQALSTKEDSDE